MSETVKFTLDGEQVVAEKGMTIWEVANGRGLVIPHLCHKPAPGYRPDGNCRACMVEIEGERTLAASCIREPQEGMVVVTNNARATSARKMVVEMAKNDMLFAVGPAGTGKTYTAVALAVKALKEKEVRRIILTRPAVESGENLGFLPGDLKEKLDPYMQPLYDALRDMIPHERLESHLEKGVIQIAPLAFMRGRTLDNAFVILDEAQNTTHNQMKMFLTRMGMHAKFIITGDPGQIDLPRKQVSGLKESLLALKDINGIAQVYLDDKDVVRHRLVRKIITAYKSIETE